MNLRVVSKLAVVLTKSQLRGYQKRKIITKIFGNPRILLVTNVTLIVALGVVSHYLVSNILPNDLRNVVQQAEVEGLAGVPTAIVFAMILFGILSEISQPIQSMSTDLVNWLPISPSEYVAGSAISLSYTYAFIPAFFLGAALGPAVHFGMLQLWLVATVMSGLALFVGAFVVEMLRAITNRISSSFYKRSPRSGMFVRLSLTILILVFVQLIFSGRIVLYLLQAVMQTVRAAWLVPAVWPSLVVLGVFEGNLQGSLFFGVLSFGFMLALFGLAVNFRTKFWVPIAVSIKLTSEIYRPLGRHKLPLLDVAESAIFLKDLRSLTRRREMARFLAIPFILVVSTALSIFPMGGTSVPDAPGFLAMIPLYVIPLAIFCNLMSMTSIGQEGDAVWNLYTAPLRPRQLIKAKLLLTVLLGLIFSVAMLAVLGFLLKAVATNIPVLFSLGVAVVLEESLLGLYFGAKFPDFRETVRSRYVSFWGSILGTLTGLAVALLTATPIMFSILFRRSLTSLIILSFAAALVVFSVAWKLAERQSKILLQNVPV